VGILGSLPCPYRAAATTRRYDMRFMNSWDIDRSVAVYDRHPILGPASKTLQNLERWTNENSDGWAYWPKPCRAAKKLMELLDRDPRYGEDDVTEADYKAALQPIKSFRTRQGADFVIEVIGG
jgi:hypothetical protein